LRFDSLFNSEDEVCMKSKTLKLLSVLALAATSVPGWAAGACCVAGALCCGLPCCL
jgi:hypothetical protein